ncbi:MAG: hypothetical protein AB7U85_05110 [Alphaproteobacteria bacterium]
MSDFNREEIYKTNYGEINIKNNNLKNEKFSLKKDKIKKIIKNGSFILFFGCSLCLTFSFNYYIITNTIISDKAPDHVCPPTYYILKSNITILVCFGLCLAGYFMLKYLNKKMILFIISLQQLSMVFFVALRIGLYCFSVRKVFNHWEYPELPGNITSALIELQLFMPLLYILIPFTKKHKYKVTK